MARSSTVQDEYKGRRRWSRTGRTPIHQRQARTPVLHLKRRSSSPRASEALEAFYGPWRLVRRRCRRGWAGCRLFELGFGAGFDSGEGTEVIEELAADLEEVVVASHGRHPTVRVIWRMAFELNNPEFPDCCLVDCCLVDWMLGRTLLRSNKATCRNPLRGIWATFAGLILTDSLRLAVAGWGRRSAAAYFPPLCRRRVFCGIPGRTRGWGRRWVRGRLRW